MPNSPDYSQGKIYKIVYKEDETQFYIGATAKVYVSNRISLHRLRSKERTENKLYKFINEHGGWNNFSIQIIEYYPCKSLVELNKREAHWIHEIKPTLNTIAPPFDPAERKQKYLEKARENYKKHPEYKAKGMEKVECDISHRIVSRSKLPRHKRDSCTNGTKEECKLCHNMFCRSNIKKHESKCHPPREPDERKDRNKEYMRCCRERKREKEKK